MLTDRLHLFCPINIPYGLVVLVGGLCAGGESVLQRVTPLKGRCCGGVYAVCEWCVCVRARVHERVFGSLPCQLGAQLQKPSSVIGQQGTTACRAIR